MIPQEDAVRIITDPGNGDWLVEVFRDGDWRRVGRKAADRPELAIAHARRWGWGA